MLHAHRIEIVASANANKAFDPVFDQGPERDRAASARRIVVGTYAMHAGYRTAAVSRRRELRGRGRDMWPSWGGADTWGCLR